MYRELAPKVIEELDASGSVMFIVDADGVGLPEEWEGPIKYRIDFHIHAEKEHIFNCLLNERGRSIQITDVEPSDWMKEQSKGVLDGYVYIMLKSTRRFANRMQCKRLFISSGLPMFAEYLVDLGFHIRPRGAGGKVEGFVSLDKEK